MGIDVYSSMQALLVLEDAMLLQILKDQRYLTAFPFLQSHAAQARVTTGCCGGGRRQQVGTVNFNAIKKYLAEMPNDLKSVLKGMLQCQQCRVRYMDNSKLIQFTF